MKKEQNARALALATAALTYARTALNMTGYHLGSTIPTDANRKLLNSANELEDLVMALGSKLAMARDEAYGEES